LLYHPEMTTITADLAFRHRRFPSKPGRGSFVSPSARPLGTCPPAFSGGACCAARRGAGHDCPPHRSSRTKRSAQQSSIFSCKPKPGTVALGERNAATLSLTVFSSAASICATSSSVCCSYLRITRFPVNVILSISLGQRSGGRALEHCSA